MESRYLIDTNCIIEYAHGNLPIQTKVLLDTIIDNLPSVSIINKIEVLGFSNPGKTILKLIEMVDVIRLTDEIANLTISIRKIHKIKLPDAIIAATALNDNLILVTRNTADFKMIQGLTILNPWKE